MSAVKLAVVYYSTYGHNHQMAETAARAAREAGADVRLLKVRETAPQEVVDAQEAWKSQQEETSDVPTATPDDLVWADAYLFSSPTRYGGAASQMRSFIDTLGPVWQEGKLADKAFSAMTSAGNVHGGQETTLQTLYVTAMHWGCVLVPPGYTGDPVYAAGGNPYGTSVTADSPGISAEALEAIRHQTRRLVRFAERIRA
ncbi:MAG: NAD(P)H:quinone oxidoreductase [Actinobacteria bacterium]|nr:NAD(P)H:quinone oxidoreductase [Actinomycetota bacterium]